MRYVTALCLCALGIGISFDVRQHMKLSAAIADQADRLSALRSGTAELVGQIARLEGELLLHQERSSGTCECAASGKSASDAQSAEARPSEKTTPVREIDWSAYERARSILDRGVANGSWTQEDADEFRLAAVAAGGDKTIELVKMKVAALNAQKIHGRFVP
jgi:hypothetical protein